LFFDGEVFKDTLVVEKIYFKLPPAKGSQLPKKGK
jgi:hypothetical protein